MRVGEQALAALPWYLRPRFWLQRRRSPLEPGLHSLIQTRISQLNHCAFCIDLNALLAAFQNMSAKFNAALDIPAQGFCRVPERKAT